MDTLTSDDMKPETKAFRQIREFIDLTDPLLGMLADMFRQIAEHGTMDQLFVVTKVVDMMIADAQSRIALRN